MKASGYNLDIKNPNGFSDSAGDPDKLLAKYKSLLTEIADIRDRLKAELISSLERD